MPADSDSSRGESGSGRTAAPTLPHTWRPFGVRIAVGVLGAMLLAVCVAFWLAIDDEIRAQFTTLERITLVLIGLLLFAAYYALVRSKVIATTTGLRVVNGYRTHSYEWSQVI